MWLHLRTQGHDVARCTVERLMAQQGWVGALRGKQVRTTIRLPVTRGRRTWSTGTSPPPAPNQLWVADFTYVATWSGTVYVAFVFDVFSRRIVGWRAATSMTTELVLDALEHAIWTRDRDGVSDLSGLVHHTDAGSQGGFNWSSQHLVIMEVFSGSSTASSRPGDPSEVEVAWSSEVSSAMSRWRSGREIAKGLLAEEAAAVDRRVAAGRCSGGSATLAACHRST